MRALTRHICCAMEALITRHTTHICSNGLAMPLAGPEARLEFPISGGRVPLAYDGTGGRITSGGSGLNGQLIGASLDQQVVTLTTNQIPAHYHANTLTDPTHGHIVNGRIYGGFQGAASSNAIAGVQLNNGVDGSVIAQNAATGLVINNANAGGGSFHNNVQPSLMTGISVIRAA
jgi:microcystin-dependent protein